MADVEYRCFVGGLAWPTTDQALHEAFSEFGEVVESKIIKDRETGRSRGFGFVTFKDDNAMRDAIEGMNGQSLDGRSITVNEAQSRGGGFGEAGSRENQRNQRCSVTYSKGCNASKKSKNPALARHSNFKHRPRLSNAFVCAVGDQSARLKTRDVTFPDGTTCTFSHLVTKHNRCIERESKQKMTDEDWAEVRALAESMEKSIGAPGFLAFIKKDKQMRKSFRHLDGFSSPV